LYVIPTTLDIGDINYHLAALYSSRAFKLSFGCTSFQQSVLCASLRGGINGYLFFYLCLMRSFGWIQEGRESPVKVCINASHKTSEKIYGCCKISNKMETMSVDASQVRSYNEIFKHI
jgi:hypothetical protein